MQPIGPLMQEHRLIERMISLMETEAKGILAGNRPDARFIDEAVDFFRTFADTCHHGKEEDILFKELAGKPLSDHEKKTLEELILEHARGRKLVTEIFTLNLAAQRDDTQERTSLLAPHMLELAAFYRVHIAKEDKDFFFPVMRHFTRPEADAMLTAFEKVDGRVFHDKYATLVQSREEVPCQTKRFRE